MFCESCEVDLFMQLEYHLANRLTKLRTDATDFLAGEGRSMIELAALAEHSAAKPGGSVVFQNLAGDKSIQNFYLPD